VRGSATRATGLSLEQARRLQTQKVAMTKHTVGGVGGSAKPAPEVHRRQAFPRRSDLPVQPLTLPPPFVPIILPVFPVLPVIVMRAEAVIFPWPTALPVSRTGGIPAGFAGVGGIFGANFVNVAIVNKVRKNTPDVAQDSREDKLLSASELGFIFHHFSPNFVNVVAMRNKQKDDA